MQLRKKLENIQASMGFEQMTVAISLHTALPSTFKGWHKEV